MPRIISLYLIGKFLLDLDLVNNRQTSRVEYHADDKILTHILLSHMSWRERAKKFDNVSLLGIYYAVLSWKRNEDICKRFIYFKQI